MNWSRSTCRTQSATPSVSPSRGPPVVPAPARAGPGNGSGPRRMPRAAVTRAGCRSVAVPAATRGRARARGRGGRARQGDHMPDPAGNVEPVALVHPGAAVADVGVQRVPVEGGLLRPVGPSDRAKLALHAG